MTTKFTFQVPTIGSVRIQADDLGTALMELADRTGVKLTSIVRLDTRKPKGVVRVVRLAKVQAHG